MKSAYQNNHPRHGQCRYGILFSLLVSCYTLLAQPATVGNPLAIGQNCSGGGSNFKSFTYDSLSKLLIQVGADCFPNLASPGFNPGGGSIAFSPKDQKVYYIETTTGNNSIVWSWTPGVCPTAAQAPIYTYANTFIVGLEFNTITGDGYQLEFSTASPPYDIYLRKVTSFSPLTTGAAQQIFLPPGINIYQQNGDIAITPTGKMYFILDNKMFGLDYSTYGLGPLNANYIDTLKNGPGNNVIGLAYANGNFIASVLGGSCSYKQIDISSGTAVVQNVSLFSGSFVSYDMATMVTGIGAAKRISSLSVIGPNQYQVNYDVKVKNYGNVDLTAVQLIDSVATVFGSTFISATAAAVGSLPLGLTLNPSYDGLTDAHVFAAGSTMKASPADSATIRITVNLNNPDKTADYLNSAIATATGAIFSNIVRDSSDNQMTLNPDVSGTDVPDITGEGVPTPLNADVWLLLPNKLVDFNARRNGEAVDVSWTVDNQTTGTTTVLQRSSNGINFESLVTLNSKPISNQQYSWQDAKPLPANNYYRLQVSSPGSSSIYSASVLIRKSEQPVILTVMPNPFIQSLKFSLNLDKAARIDYRILDYVSSVLQTGQYNGHAGQNEVSINNLGNIPAGANVLEVIADGKHYFRKIIKLK